MLLMLTTLTTVTLRLSRSHIYLVDAERAIYHCRLGRFTAPLDDSWNNATRRYIRAFVRPITETLVSHTIHCW